jgi:hypothetical protein
MTVLFCYASTIAKHPRGTTHYRLSTLPLCGVLRLSTGLLR